MYIIKALTPREHFGTIAPMKNERIHHMLQLQQRLNDETNGTGWEAGKTAQDKTIDWKRCIYMECAEMIDSFAWKHWKAIHADPDWNNLQIEVVDVWHFVMSLVLQEYRQRTLGTPDDAADAIAAMPFYQVLEEGRQGFATPELVMIQVESLMRSALSPRPDLTRLLADFFDLVRMSALDAASLYRLYVGKNVLNRFRQDHGYKAGTYVKVWHGKEDNVVMRELFEQHGDDLEPEKLYGFLVERYPG